VAKPTYLQVPFENNPWFPLPPDYHDLTKRGQRMSRVNACSMQDDPRLAVYAWSYFRRRYLLPDEEDNFHPGFYDEPKPCAPFHFNMVYQYEANRLNAMIFPRGGGKTKNAQTYFIWKLCTNPGWLGNVFVYKYQPFGQDWMLSIKAQLQNSRIVDDFGKLRPSRDEGGWAQQLIRLRNNAEFKVFTIGGGIRGARGHFNLADDIEQKAQSKVVLYDPAEVELTAEKLKSEIVPSLKAGANLGFQGTIVHVRCLLNHIATCDDEEGHNYDPTFLSVEKGGYWHKTNFPLIDDKGRCVYEDMFPPEHIEFLKRTLGPERFSTEMLGKPMSPAERIFHIQPDRHEWWMENEDEHTFTEPYKSRTIIHWNQAQGSGDNPDQLSFEHKSMPLPELLDQCTVGITVDPTRGQSALSDWAVIHVVGMDPWSELWSFDLWAEKVRSDLLIPRIWEYAYRWRASVVGIEEGGLQTSYFAALTASQERLLDAHGWVPQAVAIAPPTNMSKEDRISRLEWRVRWGKINLCRAKQYVHPYSMLYDQFLGFTLSGGNLKNDDAIDTFEMAQTLFHGRKGNIPLAKEDENDPLQQMLQGKTFIEGTNLPLAGCVDPMSLPPKDLENLIRTRKRLMETGQLEQRASGEAGWGDDGGPTDDTEYDYEF
jgi:hypothetical protein